MPKDIARLLSDDAPAEARAGVNGLWLRSQILYNMYIYIYIYIYISKSLSLSLWWHAPAEARTGVIMMRQEAPAMEPTKVATLTGTSDMIWYDIIWYVRICNMTSRRRGLHIILSQHDTICYAMLCYVLLCYVIWCYVMILCVMIWCDMLWYDMTWYAMVCYDMICYDMLWYDMNWYDMLCCAMPCCDMLWYDMLWYVMIWYDMILYCMTW